MNIQKLNRISKLESYFSRNSKSTIIPICKHYGTILITNIILELSQNLYYMEMYQYYIKAIDMNFRI